jgi:hypothetical protein
MRGYICLNSHMCVVDSFCRGMLGEGERRRGKEGRKRGRGEGEIPKAIAQVCCSCTLMANMALGRSLQRPKSAPDLLLPSL